MIPKGTGRELSQLAYNAYPLLWKWACAHNAEGHGLWRPNPKTKAQTKAEAAVVALDPKGALAPEKAPV